MIQRYAIALILLAAACAAGCADTPAARPSAASAASATSAPAAGQVTHVVLCWLKTPGEDAAAQRIIQTSDDFRRLPGVVSVTAGRPVPSTRPVVDSSFDVGVVITFRDEAAMAAYESSPTHVRAVKEVLQPLTSKLKIFDVKQ
jgi:hypothetical protein